MKDLQPHQYRVLNEREELKGRLSKLMTFLSTPEVFNKVPEPERERLARQAIHMTDYLAVLDERVSAFEA